nr:reverse transcriptase domain-containing protein [Tanacetum cinerariifolium]
MFERDDEIKVLREVNVELESGTKKLREKLSQEEDSEEESLEEFNSKLDNVLKKLSQEKDSPNDFYGFIFYVLKVDWKDDPLHETEDFFVRLDQSIQMMNMLKKEDQARGLESHKKRWSKMKSKRMADKDPLVSLVGNQGNVENQNGNVVNENIQENIRNVIVNGNRVGCSYKEFLACMPKEYDGKGGVGVLTKWIEKMESVQDMTGCSIDQKVKYTAGSFMGKALT